MAYLILHKATVLWNAGKEVILVAYRLWRIFHTFYRISKNIINSKYFERCLDNWKIILKF